MARRLILDTDTLIAYERGTFDASSLDDDDLAIAAITVAEFRTGIELADSPQRAAERARILTAITEAVLVLDYTATTAATHARLIAHVHRTGAPRGAHDLIIAAHALEHDRTVVSLAAGATFADLPGIQALTP